MSDSPFRTPRGLLDLPGELLARLPLRLLDVTGQPKTWTARPAPAGGFVRPAYPLCYSTDCIDAAVSFLPLLPNLVSLSLDLSSHWMGGHWITSGQSESRETDRRGALYQALPGLNTLTVAGLSGPTLSQVLQRSTNLTMLKMRDLSYSFKDGSRGETADAFLEGLEGLGARPWDSSDVSAPSQGCRNSTSKIGRPEQHVLHEQLSAFLSRFSSTLRSLAITAGGDPDSNPSSPPVLFTSSFPLLRNLTLEDLSLHTYDDFEEPFLPSFFTSDLSHLPSLRFLALLFCWENSTRAPFPDFSILFSPLRALSHLTFRVDLDATLGQPLPFPSSIGDALSALCEDRHIRLDTNCLATPLSLLQDRLRAARQLLRFGKEVEDRAREKKAKDLEARLSKALAGLAELKESLEAEGELERWRLEEQKDEENESEEESESEEED
ncbi:hypothetical protein JCM8547_007165 [Rhodosporidiobolus lusitaniae]